MSHLDRSRRLAARTNPGGARMDLGLQDGLLRDLDTTVTHLGEVAACYGNALAKLS